MKKVNILSKSHFIFPILFTLSVSTFLVTASAKQNQDVKETMTNEFVDQQPQLITNSRQLTFVGPRSGEGYFSADGKKMIFQSEREPGNPFYQMYILNLKTGASQRISPGKGKTTCGWIHPKLNKALWSSTHHDPQTERKTKDEYEQRQKAIKAKYSWSFDDEFDIYESDLQGKNLKALTKEKGYDAEASYSPDGKWIAFASNRAAYSEKLNDEDQKMFQQDPSYMMDIYLMKSDGSNVRRLTNSKGYDGGPFFSADGKKITWRRFAPNGSSAEIYTMDVDGKNQKQLTHLKSMSWAPYFHPSGDYIIFTSSLNGYANFELYLVDTAGEKNPVRVTYIDGFDGLPVFSPDGKQISWTHRSEKGDSQIKIAEWNDQLARHLLGLDTATPEVKNTSAKITQADLEKWIYYLASEKFKGRATGSPEEEIYSAQIAKYFKDLGLKPVIGQDFRQTFQFVSGVELGSKNTMEFVGSYKKSLKVSVNYLPLSFSQSGEYREAPVVFVGYGIKAPATDQFPEYNSYKGFDAHGKWVIALIDQPMNLPPARRQQMQMYSRLQHKVTVAKNEGAAGILFVAGPSSGLKDQLTNLKFEGSLSGSSIPVLRLSIDEMNQLADFAKLDLAAIEKSLDQGDFVEPKVIPSTYLKAQVELKTIHSKGKNILAVLTVPGAKSSVLIGAHGDHLGRGLMGNSLAKKDEFGLSHFGADDNASGVSSVMELAQYFSHNKGILKKNLIFAVWSGEEIGVIGSQNFIEQWKNESRKDGLKISSSVNLDMVGRLRDQLLVQGVGSGNHWTSLVEEVSFRAQLPISVQNDPYQPTDSMAIYLGKIPSITLFTGSHNEYHTPRDRPFLINYPGLEKVTLFTQELIKQLADTKLEMVEYLQVEGGDKKLEGRSFRIYLGTVPDYNQEGIVGVRLTGVSKGSPAEEADLQEKDIIVEFNGQKIENLYDYVYGLQSVRPNQVTTMVVLRKGTRVELKITPKLKE